MPRLRKTVHDAAHLQINITLSEVSRRERANQIEDK